MRRLALASSWAALVTIAIACGDDDEAALPVAPVDDGAAPDATDIVDAGAPDAPEPACRTPRAPSADCLADAASCERRTVYLSPKVTFPFALATDDDNVYWIAQPEGPAGAAGDAMASVLRASKTGAPTQKAVAIAIDQERTTTLVRDGADLYWVASQVTDAGSESTLRRLRQASGRTGCPGCEAPEDLVTFPGVARRLVRVAPGVLFTAGADGVVRRIAREDERVAVTTITTTSAPPSLAAAADRVLAGGGLTPSVVGIAASGGAASPFLTLSDAGADAATPGAWLLGASCERVFGVRDEGAFFRAAVEAPAYVPSSEVFAEATDIVADARFVYVAGKKGRGVARGSVEGGPFEVLYEGDVWRMSIDDEGIYWGEHANGSLAGNISMQTK